MASFKATLSIVLFSVLYLAAAKSTWETFENESGPQYAYEGQFPFIAHISCNSKKTGKPVYFTGTIIDDRHILTSASFATQCDFYLVRFNAINRRHGGEVVAAGSSIVHPNYGERKREYDVAVIRTDAGALEQAVKIQLHLKEKLPEHEIVLTAGWGFQQTILRYIYGDLLNDIPEKKALVLHMHYFTEPKERVHDSGSPLLVRLDGNWLQLGVANSMEYEEHAEHHISASFTHLGFSSIQSFLSKILNN